MTSTDLVVIGAGPAGLATAIHARRAGLDVVVVERRTGVRDKACGEGLMPAGVEALQKLGVELGGHRFEGIAFLQPGARAEARFRKGPGRGVRRTELLDAMATRTREVGAQLIEGEQVERWSQDADGVRVTVGTTEIHARVLVGADGLHSRIRRDLGLSLPARARKRFGVRRHFAVAPWSETVEVHWGDNAEGYVTPVGPQLVGIAFLHERQGARFEELLQTFPAIMRRIEGASYESTARGAGPLEQRVRRRVAGSAALVGDAAGYLDAISGEGLTLGVNCAEALVRRVAAGEPLTRYESDYRRLARPYYQMTELLLTLNRYPWLRRRALPALARDPDQFSTLLAIHAGELPLTALRAGSVLGLALRLMTSGGPAQERGEDE